jgi:hypothetical protein
MSDAKSGANNPMYGKVRPLKVHANERLFYVYSLDNKLVRSFTSRAKQTHPGKGRCCC